MRSCCLAFVTVLGIILGCVSGNDRMIEKELLLETDKQFAALSAESGAAEAFYKYLDSSAVQFTSGSGPVYGRDNIFQRMKPSAAQYTLLWEPQFADVSGCGDMGWTWGTYVMTVISDSSQVHGHYLNIWTKKNDGTWLVVADIGTVRSK